MIASKKGDWGQMMGVIEEKLSTRQFFIQMSVSLKKAEKPCFPMHDNVSEKVPPSPGYNFKNNNKGVCKFVTACLMFSDIKYIKVLSIIIKMQLLECPDRKEK